MPVEPKYKVTYGGWYQRTTLHLSEVYSLLKLGTTHIDLDKKKVKDFHKTLDIKTASREAGFLEYVRATTNSGIDIKYFEDGLYVFSILTSDVENGKKLLEQYFKNVFQPAISYIFSLGAPTPKILANITAIHPTVVSLSTKTPSKIKIDTSKFGEIYSSISSKKISVHKTPKYIFIASSKKNEELVSSLIEMQIFFREFKDQLERYLNIHRNIWEKISKVREKGFIKGKEIGRVREKLESYRRTVDLISGRIQQMDSYVSTRKSISEKLEVEKYLNNVFQYKFEVLSDTHEYIKDIWAMTKDHISSAIQVISELETKSATKSIQTLQIITSIGVVSGILGYLAQDELPKITQTGLIFFSLLLVVTVVLNIVISKIYTNIKYKLKFTKRARNI